VRAAVLGSPVGHSLSPVLHRAAYRALGLPGWTYEAIECDEARLPGLLAGCGPDWAGLSLTMPLKRAVLPLLLSKTLLRRFFEKMDTPRYLIGVTLGLMMLSLPIKMYLRWIFNLKYIVNIPEFAFNI